MRLILYPVPSHPLKRGVEKPEETLQRLLRGPWTRVEGWGLTASYSAGKDGYTGDGPKHFVLAPGDKAGVNNFQTLSWDSGNVLSLQGCCSRRRAPPRSRGVSGVGSGQGLARRPQLSCGQVLVTLRV